MQVATGHSHTTHESKLLWPARCLLIGRRVVDRIIASRGVLDGVLDGVEIPECADGVTEAERRPKQ